MGTVIWIFAIFTFIIAAILLIGGGILKNPGILNAIRMRSPKRKMNDRQAALYCIATALLITVFGVIMLFIKNVVGL